MLGTEVLIFRYLAAKVLRLCSNFMMPFTDMVMSVMLVDFVLASGGTFSGL